MGLSFTINQLLLTEFDNSGTANGEESLDCTRGGKGPAGCTLALVFNFSIGTPINTVVDLALRPLVGA